MFIDQSRQVAPVVYRPKLCYTVYLANKESDAMEFIKYYESKEFLQDCLAEGMTSRDISKQCHVSYKLINRWLLNHGLIKHTPDLKLP